MHESTVLSQHTSRRRDRAEIEGRIDRPGCVLVCLPGRQDEGGGRWVLEALLQQQRLESIPSNQAGTCIVTSQHHTDRSSGCAAKAAFAEGPVAT